MGVVTRGLLLLLILAGLASPARADDVGAAARGVVRVVVIAFEDGEVADFGHGSGFAVSSDRVVTNAHVVSLATELPSDMVVVGVVPPEGSQAFRARIVKVDPARDLALLELEEGSLPPLGLYVGPLEDGMSVAALGYPGNVDLATARSAEDYINPIPPTRSAGILSNLRMINRIATLLHTASIARGHSGGPLLDPCGRVIGVNTLITRNENGDAGFAFAVANRELTGFLREAGQAYRTTSSECVSMEDRLRDDEERREQAEAAEAASLAARERTERERALALLEEGREARLALAILLLVLAVLAFGAAGIFLLRNRERPAVALAVAGGLLLIGAILVFLSRPSVTDLDPRPEDARTVGAKVDFAGPNLCTLIPERSRVTISSTEPVALEWDPSGCVNQRTQYARNGDRWTRILVPDSEQAVSVLEIIPDRGEYVVSRYQLGAAQMARIRALRQEVGVKACTADGEARTILADQLRSIEELLPDLPNERLVYQCGKGPD